MTTGAGQRGQSPLISVVIPVYNAEQYVEQAVRSALGHPRDLEVIVIEDGSTDCSLAICRKLAQQSDRVMLLRHRCGENRGVSASRNLGIRCARGRYVAFLDADDYYLPNRFERDIAMMERDPEIDGVYGAVRTHFESRFTPMPGGDREVTTFERPITPEELFSALVTGGSAWFCTNGITVRHDVFDKTGLFDEDLVLAQDSAMWVRMAATCRLVAGSIQEPIAVRRRHARNRTSVDNPRWHRAGCAYVWSVLRWSHARKLNTVKIAQLRLALALAVVGRREGAHFLSVVARVARRTLVYGFAYLPLLPALALIFARKLLGRPVTDPVGTRTRTQGRQRRS